MPLEGKEQKITEDGGEKDAFVVTFTNGARQQLADLKMFFKQENELELIKLAISLLENVKENRQKTQ